MSARNRPTLFLSFYNKCTFSTGKVWCKKTILTINRQTLAELLTLTFCMSNMRLYGKRMFSIKFYLWIDLQFKKVFMVNLNCCIEKYPARAGTESFKITEIIVSKNCSYMWSRMWLFTYRHYWTPNFSSIEFSYESI